MKTLMKTHITKQGNKYPHRCLLVHNVHTTKQKQKRKWENEFLLAGRFGLSHLFIFKLFIYLFACYCTGWIIVSIHMCLVYLFFHLSIYSFIHLFIYSFIHLFIYSSVLLFIYSLIHLFIDSFIHFYSFIHWFIDSLTNREGLCQVYDGVYKFL